MKFYLCILLFLIGIRVNGQHTDVAISSSLFAEDSMINTSLLFSESDGDGGMIIVRKTEKVLTSDNYPKEYYIQHYDKDLHLISETNYNNEDRKQFKGLIVKNGYINLIQFEYDNSSVSIKINTIQSKIKTLKFEKKELMVLGKDQFISYYGDSNSNYLKNELKFAHPIGNVKFSKNKKFFAIRFDLVEKQQQDYHMIVYDNNFVLQFEAHHRNADKYSDVLQNEVQDIDGSILLLQKNYENKSREFEKDDRPNFHHVFYKMGARDTQKLVIKEDNLFVNGLFITTNKDDTALVGFYGNEDEKYINGLCRYNIDSFNLDLKKSYKEPFSDQLAIDKYEDRTEKKAKQINNLKVRDLRMDDAGSIILSGEECFYGNKTFDPFFEKSYVSKSFSKRDKYHFDHILSMKVNVDGKIIWSRFINKKQVGLKKSSFTTLYDTDKVRYFFNGNRNKMENNREMFNVSSPSRSNLFMVTITKNGMTSDQIISGEKSRIWYDVRNAVISTDARSVIFQGIDRREKQMLKVSL